VGVGGENRHLSIDSRGRGRRNRVLRRPLPRHSQTTNNAR